MKQKIFSGFWGLVEVVRGRFGQFAIMALVCFVGIFTPCQRGYCAEVIAILCCDTEALDIQEAIFEDLEKMRAEARRIAMYTERDLTELIFTGDDLFPKKVLAEIDELSCQPDDIVIFYFTGHGFRTSSKEGNPWPNLFFTISKRGIDYDKICQKLISKKPHLLWAIADCCNNFLEERVAPPLASRSHHPHIGHKMLRKNYKRLFQETSGMIMIASSDVGEYSWCSPKGALYTCALLDSLKIEVQKSKKVSWESLLKKAELSVSQYQKPIVLKKP